MTGASIPCKACGSAASITTLESFRGEEGTVAVIVNGMPALVCAKGHKRFLSPEFVSRLMDFVADPDRIVPQPPAVRRGMFKKHYHCSACDAELPAMPEGKSSRELDAAMKNAAPFKVVVEVALHKCAGCGREQALSNEAVAEGAFKALAHGFHAADVHVDR